MTTPDIKFVRILRDCGYNKDLAAQGIKRALIYDFNVVIDSEHRATFKSNKGLGAGYSLYDPVGRRLRTAEACAQSEFMPVIKALLSHIPTLADIEERKRLELEAAERVKAEQLEYYRRACIQDHAFDLLALAKRVAALSDWTDDDIDRLIGDARELVEKAMGGQV